MVLTGQKPTQRARRGECSEDPGGSWTSKVSGATAQGKRMVCHKRGNPETEVGRTLNVDEQTHTNDEPGRLPRPKRRREAEGCQGVGSVHSTLRR
jgi:hypothetical protein